MAIEMKKCSSSNIHSHGFDEATNTLAICFRSGGQGGATYHYKGVTKAQYAALQASESVGKWFQQNIRSNPEKHPGMKQ